MVVGNPVVKEPKYFNIFKYGNNLLKRIDVMCKRSCMEKSRDKYYTEFLTTIIDCNNHNDAPLSNENIRIYIYKVIVE